MSDGQKPKDYGQQFKTELENALSSGDFSGLNQLVSDTVAAAVSGVADQVSKATDPTRTSGKTAAGEKAGTYYDAEPGSYRETTMYREDSPQQGTSSPQQEKYGRYTPNFDGRDHGYSRKTPNYDRYDPNRPRPDRTNQFQRSKYDFRTPQTAAGYRREAQGAARQAAAGRPQGVLDAKRNELAVFRKNGRVPSILMRVFGGVGTGICGSATLVFLLLYMLMVKAPFLAMTVLFFLLTTGSLGLLGGGISLKDRLNKAQRYFELCRQNGYINISQLAERTGQKEKKLVKDLKRLIAAGIFPQGHLDQEETCFMLTDETYAQYRRVEQQRQEMLDDDLKKQQKAAQEEAARAKAEEGLTPQQKELRRMIEEGQSYIRQIREKNDSIPGEIISEKLYRMENLLKEIFENLEKMPEQMPKMQRLMHYYLPTTLKLVSAYEQFDSISVPGDDVVNAKKEIENTIDTINDAYGELLNKLFADSAMDVTTDAQVMRTMLAKEGLVDGAM